jgi:hypothetical protein
MSRFSTCLLGITFGVASAMPATSAYACRCQEPATTSAAYSRAALVVEGQVVEIKPRPEIEGSVVKLVVARAWKADTGGEISLTTGSDCRYDVERGKSYLLFLVRTPAGELTTGRCMGNGATSSKQKALAWLRKSARRSKVVEGK